MVEKIKIVIHVNKKNTDLFESTKVVWQPITHVTLYRLNNSDLLSSVYMVQKSCYCLGSRKNHKSSIIHLLTSKMRKSVTDTKSIYNKPWIVPLFLHKMMKIIINFFSVR